MAKEEKDETEETEVTETEETETEEAEEDPDEANWARMRGIVSEAVEEKLKSWSGPQTKKTTSSRLPRKAAPPKRRQGFLSGGFFKGLDPDE